MKQCIGPYEVVRELPEDRVGRVYLAVDGAKKKPVLVKAVRPELAEEPHILARLYSQAETLALLSHEHIARLFGFVRREDGLFLVMEHVEGKTLQSLLKEKGRLDIAVALAFFKQILSAVMYAHRLSVVHGDLKPSNVIIRDFGRVKVLDFAIAAIFGNPSLAKASDCGLRYMSPEQIDGGPIDVRSDIYSLGILLYELIVGAVPFDGPGSTSSALRRQSTPLLPSLLVPTVPGWLDAFTLRALAPVPAERFSSVAAMSHAIGAAVENYTIRAPHRTGLFRREGLAAVANNERPRSTLQPQTKTAPGLTVARGATVVVREKRAAFAVFTARCGAALDLRPSVRRWRVAARVRSRAFGTVLLGGCRRVVGTSALAASALQRGVTGAARPASTAAHGAVRLGRSCTIRWGDHLRNLLSTSRRLREHACRTLESVSETGWKRYAVLTTVLTAVLIETFVFNGANTLFNSELPPPPAAIRVGALPVSEIAPAETPAGAVNLAKPEAPREPKAAKRSVSSRSNDKPFNSGGRGQSRSSDRPAVARVENPHNEALISRRTVTYRVPREDAENPRPRLQDPRPTEPPRRIPEKAGTRVQLNVKWEN